MNIYKLCINYFNQLDCETCFSLVESGANDYSYQSNNKTNSLNTTKQEIYDFQLQIDSSNNRGTKECSNHNLYDNDHNDHDNHRRRDHHHRSPGVSSDNNNIIIIPKTNSPKDDNNYKKMSIYDNITYISSKVRKNKTSVADRQAEMKDRSIWFTATPWQQQFNAPKPSRPQLHAYF